MWAANNKLYSIEKSGTLYEIDPTDGSWKQLGGAGAWKNTMAGIVMNNLLYSVSLGGALYVTNLTAGGSLKLGKDDLGATVFMTAGSTNL